MGRRYVTGTVRNWMLKRKVDNLKVETLTFITESGIKSTICINIEQKYHAM